VVIDVGVGVSTNPMLVNWLVKFASNGAILTTYYHWFDILYSGIPPQQHQAMLAQSIIVPIASSSVSSNGQPSSSSPTTTWFLDSSASTHVTPNLNNLSYAQSYKGPDTVHIANGEGLYVLHFGTFAIYTESDTIHLHNVFHVPNSTKNLVCSINQRY
jgi:hypothetical protein